MDTKEYIEHEIQIRVLKETTESKFVLMQKNFDDKFSSFEKRIDDRFSQFQNYVDIRFSHVDYKINLLIGIAVIALLVPLVKSALGVM